MAEQYKGYVIDVFEERNNSWRWRFRRLDGKKIKIAFSGEEIDRAEHPSMGFFSADAALEDVKEKIDKGGFS